MQTIYEFFKWKLLTVFVVFLLIGGGSASADENKTFSRISLNEILEDVIKTSPEILEAQERYRSVVEERSIATSGYRPKIGAELTAGPEVTDGVDTNDQREELFASTATLYARQNIFNGGKTAAFVEETDARILAAAYEVITVANRVFLETSEAYINVLKTRELLELSKENVMTQEKILGQVKEKTIAGFTRLSDLSNSKARLSLAKGNHISTQQDLSQAVVKFHRQFGRLIKPEQFIMPTPVFKIPDTVDKTVDMGLRHHPALEVAKYNIHARKYAYEKSEADYWPTLDLELKAQYRNDVNGDDGDTMQASAMLKLNYLFYDGGVRDGEKGNKYRQLRKEYQRAYTERRNVNQAVRLAWNIYEAENLKKDFLNDHVDLSAETLSAFKDEYHTGRRTLLDILDMENEYNAAKVANTESDYMNLVAYYRIFQATGVLIHEFDISLLEEMHLPSEKPYDLEEYEDDLDPNRDVDIVVDVSDQCDNSIKGSTVLPFGCVEGMLVPIGYQEPEAPGPYILPKEEEGILKIDKTKKVQSIHLNTIHFHFDSAVLTDEALELLGPIAEQLIEASEFMIEVIGHTDSTGSIEYNQNLSEARAQSVYEELKKAGISEDRLLSSGKGELEPVATNETAEGRQKNRRTEFKLTQ
ncbi:TolC family outer membrane protein [Desulfobacula sp.]|uniref:TolC family outer membrane protein n=1 Tax=Desulfobacula sp. TaxID=2593537 RepID=UPI00271558CE|nr:TolC family outer membrane protein [Desulfobacula sp.]